MKTFVMALMLLVLCVPVMAGQKQTKEEKQRAKAEEQQKKFAPAETTINASPETVRAELIRGQLAQGYALSVPPRLDVLRS